MAWELFTREDSFNRNNAPFISISASRICFSGPFVRMANIDDNYRTTIFTDTDSLQLGFEFHTDKRLHSLTLNFDPKTKNNKTGLVCSAYGIVSKYKWINGVTKLPPINRRFSPQKNGRLWTITICPSFENCYSRESEKIPKSDNGVYRYLKNGEIVYIGRGNIYKRLKSFDRQSWDFDIVEYSVITDRHQQIFWENYWIDDYLKLNGRHPFYNKVSGINTSNRAQISI